MQTTFRLLSLLFCLSSINLIGSADTKSQLQEGLFEEEVNRDLPKAMARYRSLIDGFNATRQFAATAIFRLGECYRKMGDTNSATVQYERILVEFPDHTNIIASARFHLKSFGRMPPQLVPTAASPFADLDKVFTEMDAISREGAQIRSTLDFIANMGEKLPSETAQAAIKDATTSNLLATIELILPAADREKHAAFDDEQMKAALGVTKYRQLEIARRQLSQRFDALVSEGEKRQKLLELKYQTLQESLPLIQSMIVTRGKYLTTTSGDSSASTVTTETSNSGPSWGAGTNLLWQSSSELTAMARMIKESPDLLNASYKLAGSPMEYAIGKGLVPVARFLLDQGAKVAGRTRNGGSHLAIGVNSGNLAMTKLLIESGAGKDQNQLDQALGLAAKKGFTELARYLIEQKADVKAIFDPHSLSGSPLLSAVGAGQLATAKLLLENGADANQAGPSGTYPVQLLASTRVSESVEMLELLLEHGADLNAITTMPDDRRLTALHIAISTRNRLAAEFLLEHGAKIDARDSRGATPLHFAVKNGRTDYVGLLLEKKADPNLTGMLEDWSHSPTTPLGYVAYGNETPDRIKIASELLKAGASPNVILSSGRMKSLLGYVIQAKKLRFAELLLDHGAKPGMVPEDQILVHAIDQQLSSLVPRLIAAGAEVNQSADGLTPLFSAISRRDTNSIVALLKAKADPDKTRTGGQTPLDYVNNVLRQEGPSAQHSKYDSVYRHIRQLLLGAGASYISGPPDAITLRRKSNGARWVILQKADHQFSDFTLLEVLALVYDSAPPGELRFPALQSIQVHRRADKNYRTTEVDASQMLSDTNVADHPLQWGDVVEIPEAPHRLDSNWRLSPQLRAQLGARLQRQVTLKYGDNIVTRRLFPLKPDLGWRGATRPRLPGSPIPLVDHPNGLTSCWLSDVIGSIDGLMTSHDLSRVRVLRSRGEEQESQWIVFDMKSKSVSRSFRTVHLPGIKPVPIRETKLWLRDGDTIEIPMKTMPRVKSPRESSSFQPRPKSITEGIDGRKIDPRLHLKPLAADPSENPNP